MGGKIYTRNQRNFMDENPIKCFMNAIIQFVLIYLAKIQLFLEIFKQFFLTWFSPVL